MASFTFKKSGKLGGIRKRTNEHGSDEEDGGESAVIKRDKKKETVLSFQTSSGKQRVANNGADSDDDDDDGRGSSRKFSALDKMNAKIELGLAYASKRTTESSISRDLLATAANEIDTEADRDAQAIYERSQKLRKTLETEKQGDSSSKQNAGDTTKSKAGETDSKNQSEDKVYRGKAGYKQYVEVRDTSVANATSAMVRGGQIRAPTNVRMSTRWDYQPDLCKDFNETGYCVFGDSCKFLHDRTDYKHGWQLEREHAGEHSHDAVSYEIRDDDESLPFKCLLCRDSFQKPVVTKCGHYFCEKCALQHSRKSTRCYVCGRPTEGVFRVATKILERLNAQRQARDDERRRQRIEDAEEEEEEEEKADEQSGAAEHEAHVHLHQDSTENERGSEHDSEGDADRGATPADGVADSTAVRDLDIPIEQELDDSVNGESQEGSDSDSDDD